MNNLIIDKDLLNLLTEAYGVDNQFIKALEEMSELSKEILKHLQHRDRKFEITDEMGDTLATLENVRLILNISIESLNENIDFKLKRAVGGIKND